MKSVVRSSQFKKDWKKLKHAMTEANRAKFIEIVRFLQEGKKLPGKYLDHPLEGNFKNYRDCHIASDLVLIYRQRKRLNDIQLVRIGAHSVIF